MLLDLIQNIALLVALAVGLQGLAQWLEDRHFEFRFLAGLLFGVVGVIGMMTPVTFATGVIYDGRSIVLSLAGLFGGVVPATVAGIMCGLYRFFYVGGAGAYVGTAVVIEASLLGVGLRYLRKRDQRWVRPVPLLLFGLLVHALMLIIQLWLPQQMGWQVARTVGPVVLIGYPIAFLVAARVFLEGERRRDAVRTLAESEERHRSLFEANLAVMLMLDPETATVVDSNPAAERFYGWSREELKGKPLSEINTLSPEQIRSEMRAAQEAKRNHFFFQHRLADGSVRDVEVYSGSLRFADKNLLYSIVHDVTERMQAEKALREREQHLHTILQTTVDGFWVLDCQGRFIEVNDAACRMLGYRRDEILGMVITDLDVDESPEEMVVRVARIMAKGSELFEARHRRKDGTIYPVEVSSTYVDREGGRLVCFCRDLTERKQREAHIALLGQMLDTAPASITIHDSEGRFHFANEATLTLHGYDTKGEFLATNLYDLDVPESRNLAAEHLRTIAEAGQARFEVVHHRKDGSVFPLEVLAKAIDWHGKPAVLSIATDITKRKEAEEALRKNEAFQAALIACSPVALYSIDASGNVQTWNASAEKIFGWTEEEILGKPLPIVPEGQQESFAQLHQESMAGQVFIGQEVLRQRKDGSYLTGRLSIAPIRDTSGDVVGIMGAMEDITESKKLEEQLRQSQKMEAVGRLAGGVAHDFNNMLGVILGHTELALERIDASDPIREDLSQIESAARRSADLTRQLLAFARRQTVEPKTLDLNETIESMLKMLRRLIGEDIDLLWQPTPDLDAIRIDPSQVDQMLANLVVNARDAIGNAGGTVTIETAMADFDENYCASHAGALPGRYVMLVVSDDGCGMDAATRAQVFEPFFTTKNMGEGTGLGLATVYGIVKQNGGFIDVYSELGRGSTFRICLPPHVSAAPQTKPVTISESSHLKGGETVLLVEDEPSLLTLTSTMLEKLGYRVLRSASPVEAIRIAKEHAGEIHLLITDVVMPEMNGRDLARVLLSLYPSLKRLFMSGYTANVIAHQGVLDKGVNFIQKPFTREHLGEKVRQALDT
ncbi:MAG: PAS domain S-box protein [Candidatus Hydrogenedentes bacterium]|nr:PAS domain S-box protein [Candidatus Hydrogenedentota bacterium]